MNEEREALLVRDGGLADTAAFFHQFHKPAHILTVHLVLLHLRGVYHRKSVSRNMLYVVGESKLTNPLVNPTAATYTLDSGAALAPTMFLV